MFLNVKKNITQSFFTVINGQIIFLSSRDGDTLLTVKNREILILNGSRSITDLDADFKWHFLAVTWAEDGTVVIVRDFSVVTGASNGPMMPPPWDM